MIDDALYTTFHISGMISNICCMRKTCCGYNANVQSMLLFVKTKVGGNTCRWLNAKGLSRSICKKPVILITSNNRNYRAAGQGWDEAFHFIPSELFEFWTMWMYYLFKINKTINCFSDFFQKSVRACIQKPDIPNTFVNPYFWFW